MGLREDKAFRENTEVLNKDGRQTGIIMRDRCPGCDLSGCDARAFTVLWDNDYVTIVKKGQFEWDSSRKRWRLKDDATVEILQEA